MQQSKTLLRDEVQSRISVILEEMLGIHVEPQQPLMETGLDSLGVVDLHERLCASFKCELPATIAFDFPSTVALAEYIANQLNAQDTSRWDLQSHGYETRSFATCYHIDTFTHLAGCGRCHHCHLIKHGMSLWDINKS